MAEGDRIIFHCDCNAFFASCELKFLPELRDKPVAVCHSIDGKHGIVLAKNELAKKAGVVTAEAAWQARQKCPDLIFVPPHGELYSEMSQKVNEIYERYTDLVEPASIDESYLDVTGTLHLFHKSAKAMADEIRDVVRRELGITISVGVSYNKVFAKLGSDYKKPDATTEITRENYAAILWPLPVEDMLYVGHAARLALAGMRVRTIGDLAKLSEETLKQRLGRLGETLYIYVHGLDTTPVRPQSENPPPKSIGNGRTFDRNLMGEQDLRTGLAVLCDSVALRLRNQEMVCRGVQLTIKDEKLVSIQRQMQIPRTQLARDLEEACMSILRKEWDFKKPVRLLTVTAIHLAPAHVVEQLSFFAASQQRDIRQDKLESAIYDIKGRYGRKAIGRASVVQNDLGIGGLEMNMEFSDPEELIISREEKEQGGSDQWN